jgi:hypothetical protein
MKKIITTLIILTVIFANITLASWFDTDEERKQSMFDDAKSGYKMVLNKEATISNVLESLQLNIENLKIQNEVTLALQFLEFINPNDVSNLNEVIQLVLQSYNNTLNHRVRRYVADTMMNLNKEKGIELNKKIINDENYTLSDRLFQAENLVRAGVLVDCDLAKEGLKKDGATRRHALEFIDSYSRYDGKINEKGNKIDAVELIDLCSNNFHGATYMKYLKTKIQKVRKEKESKQ